jgi:hypothetical protein
MLTSLRRLAGALLLSSVFGACATTTSDRRLYAEYALDPSEHPESIDCFYDCLRSTYPNFRAACFARCDGVVASETAMPCDLGSPALCRSYRLPEKEPESADSDDETASGLFLDILGLTFDVATGGSDDDDDSEPKDATVRSPSKKSSSSSSKASWGSKSKTEKLSVPHGISKKR